ncbi:MAG: 50S ribosomal protein L17 [Puniceicoccales bacterium]|jgi:large subunit ribosomal protein L17|nr:50S ribosomal protein L17 [Puniceicoccales bacterium]
MRHGKHRYLLGRTKEHREALIANLAAALFRYGKIETTLAKAKALRPFAEKIITMAKKAHQTDDIIQKLHYRRLAIARVKSEPAVAALFNDRAAEFVKRSGGYSRIYKLVKRLGDAADMAIIELIAGDDVGYSKSKKRKRTKVRQKTFAGSGSESKKTSEQISEDVPASVADPKDDAVAGPSDDGAEIATQEN